MTTNQDALEQRARELLAAEFDKGGYRSQAGTLRSGADVSDSMYLTRWTTAIQAIIAALQSTQSPQVGEFPDGLNEVLGALDKTTPGEWKTVGSTHSYGIGGNFGEAAFELVAGGVLRHDANAIAAAENAREGG